MTQKAEYIETAKATLEEHAAKMAALKARTEDEIAEQKLKTQKVIEDLEEKIKEAKSHLGDLTNTAEDAWESVKDKFEDLSEGIGGSIKKLFRLESEEKTG